MESERAVRHEWLKLFLLKQQDLLEDAKEYTIKDMEETEKSPGKTQQDRAHDEFITQLQQKYHERRVDRTILSPHFTRDFNKVFENYRKYGINLSELGPFFQPNTDNQLPDNVGLKPKRSKKPRKDKNLDLKLPPINQSVNLKVAESAKFKRTFDRPMWRDIESVQIMNSYNSQEESRENSQTFEQSISPKGVSIFT